MGYRGLVLILIFCCGACKQNRTVTERYENGRPYRVYQIDQDSLIQGVLRTYGEDGESIFEQAHYVDGVLHGARILYYDNGNPEIEEYYNKGTLDDTLYTYYPSGELKSKQPFAAGVLTGDLLGYYESGRLKERVTYADNFENGPFVEYYPNGQKHWEGSYRDGDNEVGELSEYDSSGTLIKKMFCDSLSICRTTWKKGE